MLNIQAFKIKFTVHDTFGHVAIITIQRFKESDSEGKVRNIITQKQLANSDFDCFSTLYGM